MTKKKKTSKELIEEVIDNPAVIPPSIDKVESEPVGETLTLRQEKFCQLYALDTRFMGNGVSAYMEIYDIDTEKKWWYANACSAASRLLSNVKVYARINDLLEEEGLNDQFVDKQLLYIISQHSEMSTKVAAIKEYNALKSRVTQKIDNNNKMVIEVVSEEDKKKLLSLLWK